MDQVNNCAICNQINNAHLPNGSPPHSVPVFVLDDLKRASPPASLTAQVTRYWVAPSGNPFEYPTSVSAQVTAPEGQTLNYVDPGVPAAA